MINSVKKIETMQAAVKILEDIEALGDDRECDAV